MGYWTQTDFIKISAELKKLVRLVQQYFCQPNRFLSVEDKNIGWKIR